MKRKGKKRKKRHTNEPLPCQFRNNEYFFKWTLCRAPSCRCQSYHAVSWMHRTFYSYNILQTKNKNSRRASEKLSKLLKHYPLSTDFMNGNLSSSHSLSACLHAVIQQLVRFTTNRWTNVESKALATYRERQNSKSRHPTYFLWSCVAELFKNIKPFPCSFLSPFFKKLHF